MVIESFAGYRSLGWQLCSLRVCLLRHGYGSILISKGADIKLVSELLGHSDVTFTYNVYIGIFQEDKRKAVNLLN